MKVVVPLAVTGANLLETNVAEDDAPEWDAGATYAAQDRVIVVAQNSVYESVSAGNMGNNPAAASSTYWLRVMPTKTWRAFDGALTSPVEQAGVISYKIEPEELVRVVALVGVSAAEATVKVRNSSGTVLVQETQNLADYSEMIDALSMVTVEPTRREVAIFEGVICQPSGSVEIIIGDGVGVASVSEVIIGDQIVIGSALYGSEIGIRDFSRFDEDLFGNVSITQRGYLDTTTFQVAINTASIRRLRRKLAGLRARFALYYFTAGEQDFGTTVYGRYDSLSMAVNGPEVSDMVLRIQGASYDGN